MSDYMTPYRPSVLSSVESSNLPTHHKSALRRWYEEANGKGYISRAKHHATQTAEAVRGGCEALGIGAVAGVLASELKNGLDYDAGNGVVVPMDGVLGAMALVGSATMGPGEFVSTDMRNAGITLVGIASFRKTKEFADMKRAQGKGLVQTVSNVAGDLGIGKKSAGGARMAGEFGGGATDEDPIIAMSKSL